ncbi:MAG: EamA family transporter [Proteobacteria bacterium]|nr:EamA family transporter [Pseudomonadota bacterium]
MTSLEVTREGASGTPRRVDPRVLLAFAAIYILWGATFLAIRVVVLEVPPLFASGLRFLVAGALLYVFLRVRGEPSPTALQWRSIAALALFMFVITYAAIFWAEQYVPSGITAVIEATLPLITVTLEVLVFRRQPLRWRMAAAVVLGFSGVAVLLLHGEANSLPRLPCLVILAAGVSWSLGAVLIRSLPLPRSPALSAGGQMLLGGGLLLVLSMASGELQSFPHISLRAALALTYLVVAGSLVGFTAYVWLLTRMPATRVSSHAYVNPVVAVALGYFAGGEVLTLRIVLAAALVVSAVFLMLRTPGSSLAARQRRLAKPLRLPEWMDLRKAGDLLQRIAVMRRGAPSRPRLPVQAPNEAR